MAIIDNLYPWWRLLALENVLIQELDRIDGATGLLTKTEGGFEIGPFRFLMHQGGIAYIIDIHNKAFVACIEPPGKHPTDSEILRCVDATYFLRREPGNSDGKWGCFEHPPLLHNKLRNFIYQVLLRYYS